MFIASTNQMQVIHTNRPRLEDIKLHYIIIKRTFFETKLHPVVSFDFQYVNVLVALSSLIIFNYDINFIKL